jgi:hypothetical protein
MPSSDVDVYVAVTLTPFGLVAADEREPGDTEETADIS